MLKNNELDNSKEFNKFNAALSSYGDLLERASSFAERIGLFAKMVGGVSSLSRLTGVSNSGLKRYIEGGDPGLSQLNKIVAGTRLKLDFVANGVLPMFEGEAIEPQFKDINKDLFSHVIQRLRAPDSELREVKLDLLADDIVAIYNAASKAAHSAHTEATIDLLIGRRNMEMMARSIEQLQALMKEAPENTETYLRLVSEHQARLEELNQQASELREVLAN